ncbi:hypothetical protein B0H19DRAFT_1079268 [Mycena capillaripes]|nr:hypothetical protein B0H19DRAFT_1079268 [Mycena capillaripes]
MWKKHLAPQLRMPGVQLALNSQIGEFTYVDHLFGIPAESGPKSESQSQELSSTQDPESDNNSDHELAVQVQRLRNRLNISLQERNDMEVERNQYWQVYEQADAERSQLRDDLHHWEQAATAASALTKLLQPYESVKWEEPATAFKMKLLASESGVPAVGWMEAGSAVSQMASKDIKQHAYKVRSSKKVEL